MIQNLKSISINILNTYSEKKIPTHYTFKYFKHKFKRKNPRVMHLNICKQKENKFRYFRKKKMHFNISNKKKIHFNILNKKKIRLDILDKKKLHLDILN